MRLEPQDCPPGAPAHYHGISLFRRDARLWLMAANNMETGHAVDVFAFDADSLTL